MKKIICILIILSVVANSIGYLLVFTVVQKSIRKEIKRQIKLSLDDEEVTHLKISYADKSYKRVESKEFLYNGCMFDIITERSDSQYMYFTAINDTKEKQLFKNLEKITADVLNSDSKAANKAKSSLKLLVFEALINIVIYSANKYFKITSVFNCDYGTIDFSIAPPNPPPKFSFFSL